MHWLYFNHFTSYSITLIQYGYSIKPCTPPLTISHCQAGGWQLVQSHWLHGNLRVLQKLRCVPKISNLGGQPSNLVRWQNVAWLNSGWIHYFFVKSQNIMLNVSMRPNTNSTSSLVFLSLNHTLAHWIDTHHQKLERPWSTWMFCVNMCNVPKT